MSRPALLFCINHEVSAEEIGASLGFPIADATYTWVGNGFAITELSPKMTIPVFRVRDLPITHSHYGKSWKTVLFFWSSAEQEVVAEALIYKLHRDLSSKYHGSYIYGDDLGTVAFFDNGVSLEYGRDGKTPRCGYLPNFDPIGYRAPEPVSADLATRLIKAGLAVEGPRRRAVAIVSESSHDPGALSMFFRNVVISNPHAVAHIGNVAISFRSSMLDLPIASHGRMWRDLIVISFDSPWYPVAWAIAFAVADQWYKGARTIIVEDDGCVPVSMSQEESLRSPDTIKRFFPNLSPKYPGKLPNFMDSG